MIRTMLATSLMLLATAAFAFAGANSGDVTVWSESTNIVTYADGANALAVANIHSVLVREGSQTGYITVTGNARDVTTIAVGSSARAVTNVGNVRIGF